MVLDLFAQRSLAHPRDEFHLSWYRTTYGTSDNWGQGPWGTVGGSTIGFSTFRWPA